MKKKVVVIGDVFVDMIAEVEGFPEHGGRTYGRPFERNGGGTAGNIASGLAKLGADTTIVCGLANDEYGQYLLENLREAGINISQVQLKENMQSGVVSILLDDTGERDIYVLVKGSAFEMIDQDDVAFLEELNPDIICFTGVIVGAHPAEETVLDVAEKWKNRARLYFDPNLCYPANHVPKEIIEGTKKIADVCDVVLAGEVEMKALELKPHNGQKYIVKAGSAGSRLLREDGTEEYRIPATAHNAVDTTGAGDTFMAAFVAAEAKGYDIRRAMRYASVAAGISITRKGARNMPDEQEIEAYMETYENMIKQEG